MTEWLPRHGFGPCLSRTIHKLRLFRSLEYHVHFVVASCVLSMLMMHIHFHHNHIKRPSNHKVAIQLLVLQSCTCACTFMCNRHATIYHLYLLKTQGHYLALFPVYMHTYIVSLVFPSTQKLTHIHSYVHYTHYVVVLLHLCQLNHPQPTVIMRDFISGLEWLYWYDSVSYLSS